MKPTNHAAMVRLFNIGVMKRDQTDIPECNRIRVHPDGISAVMFIESYGQPEDRLIEITDRPGYASAPSSVMPSLFRDHVVLKGVPGAKGCRVSINRKRLVDILNGMTSDEVELHLTDSDGLLLIVGGYSMENSEVSAVICPRIEAE